MQEHLTETFIISNCDILIEQDFLDVWKYHKDSKNLISIVAAVKHQQLPYGSLETSAEGQLTDLNEKPEFIFKINTGVYIVEPECLEIVKKSKTFFHMTDLIDQLKSMNMRIGVFPIRESDWTDIGTMSQYQRFLLAPHQ